MTPARTRTPGEPWAGGDSLLKIGLGAVVLGLVLCVIGWVVDARQAAVSYLIAFAFVQTVLIGLLAFLMAAHVIDATWPTAIRRLAEAAAAATPLLLVLFLPVAASLELLYPWVHPERLESEHVRALVLHRRPVMNAPLVLGRAFVFLLAWALVAVVLCRDSRRMDRPGSPDLRPRLGRASAILLPVVGLTATIAAFDWLMALSPDFTSTMYGLYVLLGGFLAALGLVSVLMYASAREGWISVNRSHWYAMGRLLFAFVIFWAYVAFFQYLLIWIADRPVEARFYVERMAPGDLATSWFLILGHFVIPWLLLLSYAVKRSAAAVALLGVWLLGCHYVDIHWLVAAHRGAFPWQWQDAGPLLFVAGGCVSFAVWRQRGVPLVPVHDPRLAQALEYQSR